MATINSIGLGLDGATGTGLFVGSTSPTITTAVLNGTVSGTSISTISSASTLVLRDANQNAFANNFVSKATNVVSAGATTTLTSASARFINLTGSSNQTFKLPDATTLSVGSSFTLNNNSTGTLSVVDNGSNLITTVVSGGYVSVIALVVVTTNGVWDYHFLIPSNGVWGTAGIVSPTITTPQIAQINDTNGNALLGLTTTASSVNNLTITNNATGSAPLISVAGTDTNIGIVQSTKGTGQYLYYSTATSYQVLFSMGAGGANLSSFTFNSTNTTYPGRNYSFPDASGTVTLLGNSSTGSGNVVLATSPTITTPVIGQINDSLGNGVFTFTGGASVVNYMGVFAATSGQSPLIGAFGADANLDFRLYSKGTGAITLNTQAPTVPLIIYSGTGSQHSTNFTFANTAAGRTVTFPDASGALQLQSQAVISAPGNSATSALAIGTNFQNTTGSDIVLTVYLAVSAATSANILVGVGSASSPTQQTVVSGLTLAALGIIPIPIYIPNNYYALVSTSGTITQTISGQMAMPV